MRKSKQELPIGYQLPDPYENHPSHKARETFVNTKADSRCQHYPNRSQYFCTLCTYEFYEEYIKEKIMSFHPKYNLINLYEIVGESGEVEWAGESAHEAIKLLRSNADKRLLVSGWESNEEDARLIGQPLDVTQVALAAIVWER